jgi:TonB family protein
MTLVEAMTQRLPVWDAREHGEPSLPDGIPALFLDVARNSLRRDPQQRWTVAQIAERLQPVSPPPARVVTVPPRKTAAKWRYLVPAIAVGLVLLVVAGLRNGNRSPETESSAAVANEAPNAQQKPTPAVPAASRAARAASQPEVAATTPPAPAPSETAARTPKGNVVPGAVLHQVVPEASPSARNTITGKVRVRVKVTVDAAGNVTGATFDSPGPSKYFARLAMQAAPGWKFTPPQVNGRHVPSQWILRFAFGRSGTEVYQVQTAP